MKPAKIIGSMALLLILATSYTSAWAGDWAGRNTKYFGVGGVASFPTGAYSDRTEPGYGLCALFDYPFIPLLDFTADVGWTHFAGQDEEPDVDVWDFSLGARFVVGAFFMGGETGYYTEVDEWGWIPSIGARFSTWEGSLRFKATGKNTWTSLRVGYYF